MLSAADPPPSFPPHLPQGQHGPTAASGSRQGYWSGLPFPSSGDLPNPGIKAGCPTLQADSLPSEPPGNFPINGFTYNLIVSRVFILTCGLVVRKVGFGEVKRFALK